MTFSFLEREDTACSLAGGEGAWQHVPSSWMEAWGPAHVTPAAPLHRDRGGPCKPFLSFSRRQRGGTEGTVYGQKG